MRRLILLAVLLAGAAVLLLQLLRRLPSILSGLGRTASEPSSPTPWLLLLLPLPGALAALVALVQGLPLLFLSDALSYGLLLGGALLVRRGQQPEDRLTRAGWPLKTLGAGLVSLGTAMIVWLGVGHGLASAVAVALVALLGCHLTYGLDLGRTPRAERGLTDYARGTLGEAAQSIAAIEESIRDISQSELNARLQRIARLARDILRRLEEEPRDMRRARKFLNVYLDGVQGVVAGYAKTHRRVTAPDLDERFRRALITIEDVFTHQQQVLLEDDVDELDLQIEVLTQQLKRDGII